MATGTAATKARRDFRTANLDLMAESLRAYGRDLAEGRISPAEFDRRAWQEIKAGAAAQYRFAYGAPLGRERVAELNGLLDSQRRYLDNFAADIKSTESLGFVPERAALYRAAGVQADSLGHLAAAGGGTVRWVGPDGPDACADCLRHIGTYTAEEFRALGAMPGSVACLGRCRCHLERD